MIRNVLVNFSQSLRKSEQIMAIESLHDCLSELRRHQFDPLKSPDQHDFPSPSKSDTFLRDSFVQDVSYPQFLLTDSSSYNPLNPKILHHLEFELTR